MSLKDRTNVQIKQKATNGHIWQKLKGFSIYLIHQQLKMAPESFDQLMENNGLLKIEAKSA